MSDRSETATLPEVTDDSSPALVAHNVPHDCTDGPSQGALVAFYAEVQRIAQERLAIKELAARDQATRAIRADLEGRGLLKVQSNGNGEQARCHKTD